MYILETAKENLRLHLLFEIHLPQFIATLGVLTKNAAFCFISSSAFQGKPRRTLGKRWLNADIPSVAVLLSRFMFPTVSVYFWLLSKQCFSCCSELIIYWQESSNTDCSAITRTGTLLHVFKYFFP